MTTPPPALVAYAALLDPGEDVGEHVHVALDAAERYRSLFADADVSPPVVPYGDAERQLRVLRDPYPHAAITHLRSPYDVILEGGPSPYALAELEQLVAVGATIVAAYATPSLPPYLAAPIVATWPAVTSRTEKDR
jgi:hypothetical protein